MSNPRIRKRSKFQREEQLLQIAALHLEKKSQREIARAFGLSQSQINKDLREIRKRRSPALAEWLQTAKANWWAQVEELKKECLDAWFASKEPKKTSYESVARYAGRQGKTPKTRRKQSVRSCRVCYAMREPG